MNNFIESLELPLELKEIDSNSWGCNFSDSDLFAVIFSILENNTLLHINESDSENLMKFAQFKWESESGDYTITLKANFEDNIYECLVEEEY